MFFLGHGIFYAKSIFVATLVFFLDPCLIFLGFACCLKVLSNIVGFCLMFLVFV